jgi:hypothetical protein
MFDNSRPTYIDLAIDSSETKASSESGTPEKSAKKNISDQGSEDIEQVKTPPEEIKIEEPADSMPPISLLEQALTASEIDINSKISNEEPGTSLVDEIPVVDTQYEHTESVTEVVVSALHSNITEMTATDTIDQGTTDSYWNKVSSLQNNQEDEIRPVILAWAKCWSAQDVDCYLAFYSDDFQPPNKMSLVSWKEQRQLRISSPQSIQLDISDLSIASSDNDNLVIRFIQSYHSQYYSDIVHKTLMMIKEDGTWKIMKEYVND